jgi:hypothetical protein
MKKIAIKNVEKNMSLDEQETLISTDKSENN